MRISNDVVPEISWARHQCRPSLAKRREGRRRAPARPVYRLHENGAVLNEDLFRAINAIAADMPALWRRKLNTRPQSSAL